MPDQTPPLTGDARAAVLHRGSHLQIIASAGSGKTEVISQRVVDLLAGGAAPESIVAFTFTEKAAASLKARIQKRAAERLGEDALGRLAPMYVGTIHAYCFRLLQTYVPRYEAFDVLDENRLAAFLAREGRRIQIKDLAPNTLFASMKTFIANLEVVENELIAEAALQEPFASVYSNYLERLDAFRLLTFGQLTARAVAELDNPATLAAVRAPLEHLIVDEYQDVNPAQERLIELLSADGVELCVVGDDDQAIYQWRGTDVRNIREFTTRHPGAATFQIAVNRRSRPEIIKLANRCSSNISDRLAKQMKPDRSAAPHEVVLWAANTEREQAETIADAIDAARKRGHGYGDIAILLRARTSLPVLLDVLEHRGVPVKPDGRTNLFLQQDAQRFGKLCAFLADHDWRPEHFGNGAKVELDGLTDELAVAFAIDKGRRAPLRRFLAAWRVEAHAPTQRANLVRDFYALLELLDVHAWDLDDPTVVTRMGTLARCSQILADYENVARRARIDSNNNGEVIGGQDRGEWYFRWLAIFVQNYAHGAYEDFDGEDDVAIDAVQIGTIHQAKGLEWPIVFVPSVIAGRFPSKYTGQARATWYVPTTLFNQARYNGSVEDERRLLYVALTRARDQLLVSSFGAHKPAAGNRYVGAVQRAVRHPAARAAHASRRPRGGRARRRARAARADALRSRRLRRLRDELPPAHPARLPADARRRARLRPRRAPRPARGGRTRPAHAPHADRASSSTSSSTTSSSCPPPRRSPTRSSRSPPAGSWTATSATTPMTCTASGRSSARSSCASTARSSPGAPTSSSTSPMATRAHA